MLAFIFGLVLAAAPPIDLPNLGQPIGDMPNWFNGSDWTSSRAGGSVRFKVIFDRDGLPDTCVIQATTGNKEVEKLACAAIKRRFRFKPSFDAGGEPVSRVLIRSVAMGGSIPEQIRPQALLNITVNGFKDVHVLSVVVDVNKEGGLVKCVNTNEKGSIAQLSKAVCRSLAQMWEPLPEVDAAGAPVRYVRDVSVNITSAP